MNEWTRRGLILAAGLVAGVGIGWVSGFRHGQSTGQKAMLTVAEDELRKHSLLDEPEDAHAEAPRKDAAADQTAAGKQPGDTPDAR